MCDFNPFPQDNHKTQIYTQFLYCKKAQKKVLDMAIYKYKKLYPDSQPIVYEYDVQKSMEYILNAYSQFENLHNLTIQSSERLFQVIVENRYVEDELFLQDIEIAKRVHDHTLAMYETDCKKFLCNRPRTLTQNIL